MMSKHILLFALNLKYTYNEKITLQCYKETTVHEKKIEKYKIIVIRDIDNKRPNIVGIKIYL